jgi:hypothetical protein
MAGNIPARCLANIASEALTHPSLSWCPHETVSARQPDGAESMVAQIFVVVSISEPPAVERALETAAPDGGYYKIKDGVWFVQFDGTSQDLAEKLGVRTPPTNGTGVVTPIGNYSGRGPTDMWEWLKVHWPKDVAR